MNAGSEGIFPKIYFVIPWVDGADPVWQEKKRRYHTGCGGVEINRYRDWGTLKYWFRGVDKFASWVNKVYFITDNQIPEWMDVDCSKLTVVQHTDYIPGQYLPTFNSHSIELNIHKIKNLSEHFVYFNDDMFIIRPVKPTLFFRNNLPCDDEVLSPIIMDKISDIGKTCANNMSIINKHFSKKKVIADSFWKWFSPCYGKQLLRTFCLIPWRHLPGFYNDHLPQAFLKSSFQSVWSAEAKLLDEVCTHRFRDYGRDVNQWLIRYWQFCEGKFMPVSPKRGICFTDVCREALTAIYRQRYPLICINDSEEQDFERHQKELLKAFEHILPEKSIFER